MTPSSSHRGNHLNTYKTQSPKPSTLTSSSSCLIKFNFYYHLHWDTNLSESILIITGTRSFISLDPAWFSPYMKQTMISIRLDSGLHYIRQQCKCVCKSIPKIQCSVSFIWPLCNFKHADYCSVWYCDRKLSHVPMKLTVWL